MKPVLYLWHGSSWTVAVLIVVAALVLSCENSLDVDADVPPDPPCDTTCPPVKPDTVPVFITDTLLRKCWPDREWKVTNCYPLPRHWPDSIVYH